MSGVDGLVMARTASRPRVRRSVSQAPTPSCKTIGTVRAEKSALGRVRRKGRGDASIAKSISSSYKRFRSLPRGANAQEERGWQVQKTRGDPCWIGLIIQDFGHASRLAPSEFTAADSLPRPESSPSDPLQTDPPSPSLPLSVSPSSDLPSSDLPPSGPPASDPLSAISPYSDLPSTDSPALDLHCLASPLPDSPLPDSPSPNTRDLDLPYSGSPPPSSLHAEAPLSDPPASDLRASNSSPSDPQITGWCKLIPRALTLCRPDLRRKNRASRAGGD